MSVDSGKNDELKKIVDLLGNLPVVDGVFVKRGSRN